MKWQSLVLVYLIVIPLVSCLDKIVHGFVNSSTADIELVPFDNTKHYTYHIPVLLNGSFQIPILEKDSYLLTVNSVKQHIHPNRFRIDYLQDDTEPKIWELRFGDEFKSISDLNRVQKIFITNVADRVYIQKRNKLIWESGIIAYLLNNPLYLMIALVLVLFSLIPIVLNYIDPDIMDKLKEE